MSPKYKVILGVVALAAAFAFGRYSVKNPAVKTDIESTTSTDTKVDKDTHKVTTTVTEKQPDGAIKTITKTVEDTNTKRETNKDVSTHVEQTVTPSKVSTLNVSALVGIDQDAQTMYGASVSKEWIGPVRIGVFGLINTKERIGGLSVGLDF